jgi:hypothetical protein
VGLQPQTFIGKAGFGHKNEGFGFRLAKSLVITTVRKRDLNK